MTDVREQLQKGTGRGQGGQKSSGTGEHRACKTYCQSIYEPEEWRKEDLFQIGMIGLLKAIDYLT